MVRMGTMDMCVNNVKLNSETNHETQEAAPPNTQRAVLDRLGKHCK